MAYSAVSSGHRGSFSSSHRSSFSSSRRRSLDLGSNNHHRNKWTTTDVNANVPATTAADLVSSSLGTTDRQEFPHASHLALNSGGGGSSDGTDLTRPNPSLSASNSRVYFNVGGIVFQTTEATVKHTKNRRFKLSSPTFLANYYDEKRREYFFDRDPEVFRSVLNYWRTGHLHLPATMCGPQVKEELDFWGLREVDIQPCCWNSFNQWMQTVNSLRQLEVDRNPAYMRRTDVIQRDAQTRTCHVMRLRLWKLLTDPSHSRAAKVYAYVALVFVLLAIFSFCASTHHIFDTVKTNQVSNSTPQDSLVDQTATYTTTAPVSPTTQPMMLDSSSALQNETSSSYSLNPSATTPTSTMSQSTITTDLPPSPTKTAHETATPEIWREAFYTRIHPALFVIDAVCLVFFSVEYIVKLLCASPRGQFIVSVTAVFDLLAILPDYIELTLYAFYPSLLVAGTIGFIEFMPFLRLMRVFRIFRLIRRVPGLWIMMYTLKASFKELSLMLVFLLVGTLLFSSIIFFVDDPKIFVSIPHGFWWAIVTMTTVGYGDMAPVTAWGQIVGSVTAICGVLIVGFTIPALVNNFITYYNHIEFVVQKERLLRALAEEEEMERWHKKRLKGETLDSEEKGEEKIEMEPWPSLNADYKQTPNGRKGGGLSSIKGSRTSIAASTTKSYKSGYSISRDTLPFPVDGGNENDDDDDDEELNESGILFPHQLSQDIPLITVRPPSSLSSKSDTKSVI